jgi:hypothetical protein
MRFAGPLTCTLLLVAFVAGCGSSSSNDTTGSAGKAGNAPAWASTAPAGARAQACDSHAADAAALQATGGLACSAARKVALVWQRSPACAGGGASRNACSVGAYRCLGANTDRGVVVSCSAEGRAISFIAKRGQ